MSKIIPTIFTITTIKPPYDTRTVGWFTEFHTADFCVKENAYDINETCYTYVIIEEIKEGLYQCPQTSEYWYRWNPKKEKYEHCEKPRFYKNTSNFGIG